ncbi:hypothetical protein [Austwickia chelonae]|uniref:hypothetical protein n=1 Tax=Austwickia chelonae TaxID=100225 RepID=UPI0013C2AD5F|nr:hypothetical protein [Austwickia chelonae]
MVHVPVGLTVRYVCADDRPLVAFLPTAHIYGDAPSNGSEIILIISRLPPTKFKNIGDLIRTQKGLAPRGVARFTSLPFDKTTRYSYVGPQSEAPACPEFSSSVLIDQSILIDAERAIKYPEKNPKRLLDLRAHLKWIKELDSVPGFALAECREGPGGISAARQLRAHWRAWMLSDPLTVSIEDLREHVNAYLADLSHQKSDANDYGDGDRELSMLNYLSILEAARLYRPMHNQKFQAEERISAWRSWVEQMNKFAGFSAHATLTISELLLNRETNSSGKKRNGASALLKLNRICPPTLNELHGAAYDLLYSAICDIAQSGELPDYHKKVYLFTADKLLVEFRQRVELIGQVDIGGHGIGLLASDKLPYWTHYSPTQRNELDEIDHQRNAGALRRLLEDSKDVNHRQNLIRERIGELEESLQRDGIISSS